MDFNPTDEQRELVDATRALLTSTSPLAATRKLAEGAGSGYDTDLWRQGVEMGWPALALPEEEGGLGLTLVELSLVALEQGRFLATTPFLPTVLVADAIARTDIGAKAKMVEGLLSGSATAAWGFAEFGQPWSVYGIQCVAQKSADGYVLHGAKANVQDADSATWLLIDAILDGRPARFLVAADASGVRIDPVPSLDVTRTYCDLTFDAVHLDSDALCSAGDVAITEITRTAHIAALLACAELAGIGERLLEMTLDYVGTRVQFGKPVGSFQAVKHKCADIRIWVQASTAATLYAAMALAADTADRARAVSVAKAYVSEAINRVTGEALQLHGGIGFTWEHDLHLYLRRARTLSLLYGTATHHRELLCAGLEAAVPDAVEHAATAN